MNERERLNQLRQERALADAPLKPSIAGSGDLDRSIIDSLLIGTGRGATSLWEGLQQVLGTLSPEEQGQIEAERALYAGTPVGQSVSGKVGEVIGESAPFLIPGAGAATLPGRMAINAGFGGLAGGLQYVPGNNPLERAANVGLGAGVGAVATPAGEWLGARAGDLFDSAVVRAKAFLARDDALRATAAQHGVPVFRTDMPPSRTAFGGAIDEGPTNLYFNEAFDVAEMRPRGAVAPEASNLGTILENLTSPMPFGMTKPRLRQQAAAGEAARRLVERHDLNMAESAAELRGAVPYSYAEHGIPDPADVARDSGRTLATERKAMARELYGQLNTLADKAGPFEAINARNTVQQALAEAERAAIPDGGLVRNLTQLRDWLAEPRAFSSMHALRSDLGDMVSDAHRGANQVVGAKASRQLSQLKAAVELDMKNFAEANGEDVARLWKEADTHYRENVAPYKNQKVATLLNPETDVDEALSRYLQKGGQTDRFERLFRSLDDAGRDAVRAKMLGDAFDAAMDTGGAGFSPRKFANFLEDRRGAVQTFFTGERGAEVEGFMKLMNAVQKAGHAGANPPTGARLMPWVAGAAAHMMGGPAGTVGLIASTPVIRLFLTHPGSRKLLRMIANRDGAELNTLVQTAMEMAARAAATQTDTLTGD